MIPAIACPFTSAAITYIVEAVRNKQFFSAKAGVCAVQIFASVFVGRIGGRYAEPSRQLLSKRQLSIIAISGLAFGLLRKGFGEEGEKFGSNFGYGALMTAAGSVTKGIYMTSYYRGIGSSRMKLDFVDEPELVPFFPSDGNLRQNFVFPALNPGCGTKGQLSYGDGTLEACIVPRLSQQNTFVI